MMRQSVVSVVALAVLVLTDLLGAQEKPLSERIDELIASAAGDKPVAPSTTDSEFLRRVHLDFAGCIPTAAVARSFLEDSSPDKRQKLIDSLIESPAFPDRMADLLNVVLMERRGVDPTWRTWLKEAFAANRPWNEIVAEILDPDGDDESNRAAAFFMTKRLEKYGQNPTDFPGLTRDVGRLFLGVDLQCAECHDHLFIDDYKQVDFQGLFAVYRNTFIRRDVKFPAIGEKAMTERLEFVSVFDPTKKQTGPRLPGGKEFEISAPEADAKPKNPPPPRPEFSALRLLAKEITRPDNRQFARNSVNRFWGVLIGRGLVHPFDQHHSANAATHPELLEALTDSFIAHKFDVRWLLRTIALSKAYQRSSELPHSDVSAPVEFRASIERRLSAEQLVASFLQATRERNNVIKAAEADSASNEKDSKPETDSNEAAMDDSLPALAEIEKSFLTAFANEPREPEDDFSVTVKGALFVRNDDLIRRLLHRRDGNLIDRLSKMGDQNEVTDELYLSVLTRLPSDDERRVFGDFFRRYGDDRETALRDAAWALLTSIEFYVNH